jgi:hypothetical protein
MRVVTAVVTALLAWAIWTGLAIAALPELNLFVVIAFGAVFSNGCALLALALAAEGAAELRGEQASGAGGASDAFDTPALPQPSLSTPQGMVMAREASSGGEGIHVQRGF